jgi:hypothetical protein
MSKFHAPKGDKTLTEAKLALVSAHEAGSPEPLAQALREHPAYADALTSFDLALVATTGDVADANAPDVLEVAQAARARAFQAVFRAQPALAAQPQAAISLKALRQSQGQRLTALAARLGLGTDVLSALEAGRIRVASVPRRLCDSLAEMLNATADQITAALTLEMAPALRRGQPGVSSSSAANQQVDFRDAVLRSPNMTSEQQARWLSEGQK